MKARVRHADVREAVGVAAVVGGVARQLVPAVPDPLAVERRAGRGAERGAVAGACGRGLREREASRLPVRALPLDVEAGGRDRRRRHGAVREELPVRHLLVEVVRRAGQVGRVDHREQPLGAVVGGVGAVAEVDRHDREGPVAVAGGVEGRAGRDHLRALGDVRHDRAARIAQRRRRGEVLPDDLLVLGQRVRLRLDDERPHSRADVRARRHRTGVPRDRAVGDRGRARAGRRRHGREGGAVRGRERDDSAALRAPVEVLDEDAERIGLARLHPADGRDERVLEHQGGRRHRERDVAGRLAGRLPGARDEVGVRRADDLDPDGRLVARVLRGRQTGCRARRQGLLDQAVAALVGREGAVRAANRARRRDDAKRVATRHVLLLRVDADRVLLVEAAGDGNRVAGPVAADARVRRDAAAELAEEELGRALRERAVDPRLDGHLAWRPGSRGSDIELPGAGAVTRRGVGAERRAVLADELDLDHGRRRCAGQLHPAEAAVELIPVGRREPGAGAHGRRLRELEDDPAAGSDRSRGGRIRPGGMHGEGDDNGKRRRRHHPEKTCLHGSSLRGKFQDSLSGGAGDRWAVRTVRCLRAVEAIPQSARIPNPSIPARISTDDSIGFPRH